MKSNHAWFLDSVARFKSPNRASKLALDYRQISIGSHQLTVKPELKEAALRVSSSLVISLPIAIILNWLGSFLN